MQIQNSPAGAVAETAGPLPTPSSDAPAPEERASMTFLVVVTVISLAADLVTKAWAKATLSGVDPLRVGAKKFTVIKGYWDFIYALNPGGAWSFLRGLPESIRRPFFLFVSAAAIVFIVSIYRRVPKNHGAMKWGLPLALGGAMGNLVDRIRYGQVIDFIDMYIVRKGVENHWPTYNVADIAIVIGVGLMAIDMVRTGRHLGEHHEEAKKEPEDEIRVSTAPPLEVPADPEPATETKVEENWVELSLQEALDLEVRAADQRRRDSFPPAEPVQNQAETPAQEEKKSEG